MTEHQDGCERAPAAFHLVSFEGPDAYARGGGIASRVTGLAHALAAAGFETHLWFVGDPALPGHERAGALHLHRWCQWISAHHRGGVYDGEEGKRGDLARSLPPALLERALRPHLERPGARAVVLAEEWQTVDAVLHLEWLVRAAGLRDRVDLLWNANNVFGFERIDWGRLGAAATLTTVSRYMRQRMWAVGVDPLVLPNGLAADAFRQPPPGAVRALQEVMPGRLVLAKVARWDPDKRWLLAIDTVAELRRLGLRPLLVARGGVEAHEGEVLARAQALGLRVAERRLAVPGTRGLLWALESLGDADIVVLRSPLSPRACRLLYRGADAVLAHSTHEPFGLVGLEAMAVGALVCTGNTGEDYAVPGWNALVLQTDDPGEFVRQFLRVREDAGEQRAIRRRGMATARQYAWAEVVRRTLLPIVSLARRHPPLRAARPAAAPLAATS